MIAVSGRVNEAVLRTDLTLSAEPEADQPAEGTSALTREAFLRAGGCPHCWPAEPIDPGLYAELAHVSESELRAIWGDR